MANTNPTITGRNPIGFTVDSNGNLTGIKGPDRNIVPIAAKSSTVLLGDSILARGFDATLGSYSVNQVLWANDRLAMFGSQFDIVSQLAVGGTTLQELISTQLPFVLTPGTQAYLAEIAWVHSGANNFNSSSTSNDPIEVTVAQMKIVISSLAAVKKLVIIDALNPVDQGGTTGSAARAYSYAAFNGAIKHYCSNFLNVLFNDTYTKLLDPDSNSCNPKTGLIQTVDGVHFQTAGAQVAGYGTVDNIADKIVITPYKTFDTNLLTTFTGTGGSVTMGSGTIVGTPPAGYNTQVISGAATVVITTKAPDMISYAITNSTGSSTIYLAQATNTAVLLAGSPAATVIQASMKYQVSGTGTAAITGLNRVTTYVRFSGGNAWAAGGQPSTSVEPVPIIYPTKAHAGCRITPPVTVPANPTNAEFLIGVNVSGTAALVIDISAPTYGKLI